MTAGKNGALPPGSTIGIMGGGQLGRMSACAAAALGYRVHVFTPGAGDPATEVAAEATIADYEDAKGLAQFAKAVDVVTYEFENIPILSAEWLAERLPVRPGTECLRLAQDRVLEKTFLTEAGAPVAPWRPVEGPDGVRMARGEVGRPAVLKSARFGYDGKGQVRVERDTDPAAAWAEMGGDRAVLEAFVDFEMEISVIVARGLDGRAAAYVPVQNRHKNHILDRTTAPAPIPEAIADEARTLAIRVADALELVGVLAVEMFVTSEGDLLVNEIAPRPHNSGHWTLDACLVSQFEQHIRAVVGLPLGDPSRHSDAVMDNLIGADVERWPELAAEHGARLHLYGKREIRPGRKMGHVTRIYPKGGLGQ